MSQNESLELLKKLCMAHGAPGHEGDVTEIFEKELKSLGPITKDKMGGRLCTLKNSPSGKPRLMITAHMDEVGFAVQNITPEGFIQIVALGAWWTHNMLSHRVIIKTRSGKHILGVVASTPPHFLKAAQKNEVMPIEALFVDVGATDRKYAEKDLGISIGDPIVPDSKFETLNNPDLFVCKAFDNRVGVAVMIQSLKNSSIIKPKVTLLGAATTQEEVGLRGANVMAVHAKPDVAIVLEGPPADDTPGMNRNESQGRLNGGPQVRLMDPTAIMNPKLVEFVESVAKKEKIPYQLTVRRSGGTDAGSFHLANEGIPSIVIGTPSRYIHTHNSVIHKSDYFATIALIEALIKSFDEKTIESFY